MKYFKVLLILSIAIITSLLIAACTQTEIAEKPEKTETTKSKDVKKAENKDNMLIGKSAPAFELETVESKKVSLDSIKGNPTVMVFWASYCGKCKKETPQINELAKTYMPKGVKVIGVNFGETDEKLKEGMKTFDIKYTVAKDSKKKVSESFKVKGTPTIVFLDKDGKVEFVGNKLPEDYAKKLDSMIG